ncbi:solute carrier family 25 member 53 [Pangasianodon hypophthalmus]|uniref:solute carrier family 25 member 53 n=1 Tax=Pangasianodon hypophthalmus TaxID=310915 RepID=UPI000F003E07|nr:solute carrier family 25 member 53 [Pangasianodon hypophthalmus]XP_034161560.1 solute carrier family 25 member 53 [Pangasianodon hypophthalmus]
MCYSSKREMQQNLADSNGKNDLSEPVIPLHSYMHGGISSLVCTVITFPVYKTVFRQQLHSTLIREAVLQLYEEGLLKLYRGVVPPMLMKTLQGTILFGFQNTFLQQLSPWAEIYFPRAVLPAVAGLGTGVVECLFFTPFERVQSILQNSGNDRSLPTLSKIVGRLRSETLANGWYRAFLPTLTRNALGSGLYFGLKDPLARVLCEKDCPPIASSFVSGMVSSIVISLPLYPLSVLVANMQAQVGGDNLGVRASWHQLWQKRQRSLVLLYRGGSLVILRSCISWGITTAIYDQLMKRSG